MLMHPCGTLTNCGTTISSPSRPSRRGLKITGPGELKQADDGHAVHVTHAALEDVDAEHIGHEVNRHRQQRLGDCGADALKPGDVRSACIEEKTAGGSARSMHMPGNQVLTGRIVRWRRGCPMQAQHCT
jgi:hypothetical protein